MIIGKTNLSALPVVAQRFNAAKTFVSYMLLDFLGRHHSQNLSFGSGCWIQLKWRLICVWDVPSFNKKLRHLIRQIYARFCMPEHDVLGFFRGGGGGGKFSQIMISSVLSYSNTMVLLISSFGTVCQGRLLGLSRLPCTFVHLIVV